MATTFESLWRQARNLMPGVPALTVRQWAQDSYAQACSWTDWGFLRKEGVLTTLTSRAVTVVVTQGSATVTSAAGFVASDLGRQFKVGNFVYTIFTYTDPSTIVLDWVFGADSDAAASATILDVYAVMPADFGRFLTILDTYTQRPIPFWLNQDQLALIDPARTQSDSGPRALVAAVPSTQTATLGQVQYEYIPAPTAARQYRYRYIADGGELADGDLLPGLFGSRVDALKLGVQMMAAQFPGTRDLPNPYFNLSNYDRLKKDWEMQLQILSLQDDDQYPEQVLQADWSPLVGAARTTNQLRQTDATVDDYL